MSQKEGIKYLERNKIVKLFIDSTQKVFIAALIFNNKVFFKSEIETQYKVEEIIKFFNNVPNYNEIKEIYINLGPGSFTGCRTSLLYVRTMVQLNNKIELYTTSTYRILAKQSKRKIFKQKFYIRATNKKSYCLSSDNDIKEVKKSDKEKEIDYERILDDFNSYMDIFSKVDVIDIKPIYASEPMIGEMKK